MPASSARPTPDLRALLPEARFGTVRSAAPLGGGLSGAVVTAVTTDRGEFVVRVPRADGPRDHDLHRQAARHGLAPEIVHTDEPSGATVSVRVLGPPLARALRDDPAAVLTSLLGVLREVRTLPADGLTPVDPLAVAARLLEEQSARPGFPAWAAPSGADLAAWTVLLEADPRRVPAHNDLNPGNVLWDGRRAWVIDWDTSGLNHPSYDLATLCTFLALPRGDAHALLARLEEAPLSDRDLAVFDVLRRVSALVPGLLLLRLLPALDGVIPHQRAAPDLAEVYASVQAGELHLDRPGGQAAMALALLRASR